MVRPISGHLVVLTTPSECPRILTRPGSRELSRGYVALLASGDIFGLVLEEGYIRQAITVGWRQNVSWLCMYALTPEDAGRLMIEVWRAYARPFFFLFFFALMFLLFLPLPYAVGHAHSSQPG